MKEHSTTLSLGSLEAAVSDRLERWQNDGVVVRFWEKDSTLWSLEPVPELADRLGWLDLPRRAQTLFDELDAFTSAVVADGIDRVLLLGMGGSSLAPEVFQATFGNAKGRPRVQVLDTTHPAAIERVAGTIDIDKTLFVVSSKSGGTIETMSFFRYFWRAASKQLKNPGRQFAAITDPGTSLDALARERDFRHVFVAPPDVGGRYSALSVFGLVPATLIGVDLRALLERTAELGAPNVFTVPATENPGLILGAVMGEAHRAGRDKLTLIATSSVAALPAWIEQLVAESTGKHGVGIVPVTETGAPADGKVDDRLFVAIECAGDDVPDLDVLVAAGHPVVRLRMRDTLDLGREFYRWEVATAAAGMIMGIQPFDQPDVQLAKDLANAAMASDDADSSEPVTTDVGEKVREWAAGAEAGDYVSVHAWLPPLPEVRDRLSALTELLRERTGLPVTCEFGPRFLHSTGQLHKGGANNGLFLQIIGSTGHEMAVPDTDFTFDRLFAAQSQGDAQALRQRDRRLLRVVLQGHDAEALTPLFDL